LKILGLANISPALCYQWSEREDLNLRPLGPEPKKALYGALLYFCNMTENALLCGLFLK